MSVKQHLCDIDNFGASTAIAKPREQDLCPDSRPRNVLSRLKSPIVMAAAPRLKSRAQLPQQQTLEPRHIRDAE